MKVVQWPRYTEARILYSYALKKKNWYHVIKCIHPKLDVNFDVNVVQEKHLQMQILGIEFHFKELKEKYLEI